MANDDITEAQSTLTLSTPTDIIAAVPYLIGYHPTDTFVVLGLNGPTSRLRATFRCELSTDVTQHPADIARSIAATLRTECHSVLIVGYGFTDLVTPCITALRASMAAVGVSVREALRVDEGRYWSYLCSSAECCPPEGVRYIPDSSPIPAEAVVNGLTPWPDQSYIRSYLAPVQGPDRQRMGPATRRAQARGDRLKADVALENRDTFGSRFRREGARAVRAAIDAARDEDTLPNDSDSIAWLGVVLRCVRVRDEAWARVDSDSAEAHMRLWRHVVRHVEPGYIAAPGSLLAVAAWQRRDLALAEVALDVVQDAQPEYSMARLVRQALSAGLPWEECSPEWLERVWPLVGEDEDSRP